MMPTLPIDEILPELLTNLRQRTRCILHAPPGAGKTTRVPLALLGLIPPEAGRIVVLEPRRIAAVSAARFMAEALGEEVGQTVGYTIRFDSRTSSLTRIEVLTEGILTRRIQRDPLLEGVAAVIFDEFHERNINADLGLALCLDLQRQVREDLRIVIMSATLECEQLVRLLDDAPLISSTGRSFPVEEIYLDEQPHGPLPQRVASATMRVLSETEGDVLVFLPGSGEIRACARLLVDGGIASRNVSLHQLYGDLPFNEQQAAIRPGKQRKVILATDIAETSLTIEGVRVVVDTGLSRRMRHDPSSGMNRLVTVRESKASAEQRKGRAGRLASGFCYRLFSRHTFTAMTPQTPPEICATDLSPLLLELAAWGVDDPLSLTWLDVPPAAALSAARQLLIALSALDNGGRITNIGRSMSELPLHPRLARLLLCALELGGGYVGCDLAALLAERDIFRAAPSSHASEVSSDLHERLELLGQWRRTGNPPPQTDLNALRSVDRAARHLRQLVGSIGSERVEPETVRRSLLLAFPDRLAKLRGGNEQRYIVANGKGARLAGAGAITPAPYLIAVSVGGGDQGEGRIHLATPVSEDDIRKWGSHLLEGTERVEWDVREGRVIALREERLGAIPLTAAPFQPPMDEVTSVVLGAVRSSRLALLNLDENFFQFQARVLLMRKAFPHDGWPDFSEDGLLEDLDKWLGPMLAGVRTAQQLAAVNCAAALQATLEYRQRQTLDELAPTHLIVPSGSRVRLDYCQGELPILAVKLQELFGLAETPHIAAGRVSVLLHLLSPAGRPLQVTRDLHGFWNGAYHQVKKEMKGRYPKHPWPDDPWSALPTRRVKPRIGS